VRDIMVAVENAIKKTAVFRRAAEALSSGSNVIENWRTGRDVV
jgi:hypothetical protein